MTSDVAATPTESTRESARESKVDLWLTWYTIPIFYALQGIIYVPLTWIMPPRRPDVTPEQVSAFFEGNGLGIKVGFGALMVICGLVGLSNGLIAYQIRRMTVSPALSYAFIGSLAVGATPGFLLGAFAFLAAVLRHDRDPQTSMLLYDVAYLSYIGSLGCFAAAWFVLAVAIFFDRNGIYPKWFAWATVWQIVTEFVVLPAFVFHSGPLAWNGALSFYVNTAVYVFWQVCQFVVLFYAVRRQSASERIAN